MLLFRLPLADPGQPELRSPVRFLAWLARGQLRSVVEGAGCGAIWMGAQALVPAAIGEAVNAIEAHHQHTLLAWSAVVLVLGVTQAIFGALRHRRAVTNFLTAAVRVDQLIVRQAAALGDSLARRVGEGEVASIGTTDVVRIGRMLDITARGTGAVVSYMVVAVIMLRSSVALGVVVLVGAPVGALLALPVMRPLERRQWAEREARGAAASVATDTVAGLRILRGLGGEADFMAQYMAASQRVRKASVRTALAQSVLDALQVLIPGAILVCVTYLGAHLVEKGHMSAGTLVADYAYAAFLVLPVQTLMQVGSNWSGATVAAGRALSVLRLQSDFPSPARPSPEPGTGLLVDVQTGLEIEPGKLTAVVLARPEEAMGLVDRLGRHAEAPAGVTLAGTPLNDLPLGTVRRRVMVLEHNPHLLSGTLEELVDLPDAAAPVPDGEAPTASGARPRPTVGEALEAAAADEIVSGLDEGLHAEVSERGRSLSGGQRQRILLAAALRACPDILILHEPTSAVDAHTEALVAERLAAIRRGRTTVVVAISPLLLAQADTVVFLGDQGPATGTHARLLASNADYRQLVNRELS